MADKMVKAAVMVAPGKMDVQEFPYPEGLDLFRRGGKYELVRQHKT